MDQGDNGATPVPSCISDLTMLQENLGSLTTSVSFTGHSSNMKQSLGQVSASQSLTNSLPSLSQTAGSGPQTNIIGTHVSSMHVGSSIFGSSTSQSLEESERSDMETQYVIVEEPIDIHSFNDFTSVQMAPCISLVLSDDTAAEAHILNTPRAMVVEDSDKETNHFSSIDLLVGDDDMSESSSQCLPNDNHSNEHGGGINKTLDSFALQNNEQSEKDSGKFSADSYDYQLETIAQQNMGDKHENIANDVNNINKQPNRTGIDDIPPVSAQENNVLFSNTSDAGNLASSSLRPISITSEMDGTGLSDLFNNDEKLSDAVDSCGANKSLSTQGDVVKPCVENSVKDESTDQIKEKSVLAENLGLIPTETESKIKALRAKNHTKGVRTRKSYKVEAKNSADLNDEAVITGHNHVTGSYKCGSCYKMFEVICALHDHLQDHCFGGSYHYDHLLRTAYPKFDTTCSYSQTNIKDTDSDEGSKKTKRKTGLRLKPSKTLLQKKVHVKKVVALAKPSEEAKRGRGRPRKKGKKDAEGIVTKIESQLSPKKDKDVQFDTSTNNLTEMDDLSQEFEMETSDTSPNESVITEVKHDKQVSKDEDAVPAGDALPERARKRKMSVPRKVLLLSDITKPKVPNSQKEGKSDNKIACEFCSSTFLNSRGLIRHEQEKHADKMTLQCDQCDQKFMREYSLERHKLCTHQERPLSARNERKGIYREKRKKGKHAKVQEEGKTKCEHCNKDVPNSKLDIHTRLHTGERPFICHVCGKGLISEKKLKRHLLIHSEQHRHTCEVCGQGFSMKSKLRTHMYIHTGHKPYLCSVCGAEFNNSTSLLHHHRTVHLGDKRFECNICGGRYGKKSQLEEHMFSHSSERTQTCRYCGKTFKHAKSLRRHELTHVSETKFACDQCDSKFSRKDNLERHKMCHVETALHCTFCKKKFRDRQPLLEHEQYHIKSRRFQCQICKDKFQDETYFHNHMLKNHGVTKDMVRMINALASNSPEKQSKSKRVTDDNNTEATGVEALKIPVVTSQTFDLSSAVTSTIDTLNLSMSVAGILPTSSAQDLGNINLSSLQTALNSSTSLNQNFISGDNSGNSDSLNTASNILNQQINQGFATTGALVHNVADVQTVAIINQGEANSSRIHPDAATLPIGLINAENIILNEHRLMQEALGSRQGQNQGFRLQNLF